MSKASMTYSYTGVFAKGSCLYTDLEDEKITKLKIVESTCVT